MDVKVYLETINNIEINIEIVKSVEEHYKTKLPDGVKRIISVVLDDCFISEKCRVLSVKEILRSEEFTGVDFTSLNMLPLIDCKDNDYIVYYFSENKYLMYNVFDEVGFREADSLEMLIATLSEDQ